MEKRVAILGAGASGLVAMKSCLDEGLTPVCFEKTNDIGGLWNFKQTCVDGLASVTKSTVINTSKEMMCYSDFPIPDDFPNFMHNTKLMEYFRCYADYFKLLQYVKFQHEVVSVLQADDFAKTGEWLLEYRDCQGEQDMPLVPLVDRFQAVLICTGHHAEKRMPKFLGEEKFKGRIVHTHDYKDHRGFEDSSVVVVGIGNSGGDVAVELSKIAKQVYLSTRRGTWMLNRVGDGGQPSDVQLTRRVTEVVRSALGPNLMNKLMKAKLNMRINHKMYGLEPSYPPLSQHPMVNDELPNRIICGSVQIKPNIRRITEHGVIFEDGTEVATDVLIYATGYVFGFPYLQKGIVAVKDNEVSLYKYCFPPDLHPGTLAVIGCVQPWGAINPIAELQCRWAARVFKGETKLPPKALMWEDIRHKKEVMRARYVSTPRHTIQVDWIPFMDEVAMEFGVKPDLWQILRSDPSLWKAVFFGPCTPYQYRLQGPGAWSGARKAILTQMQRVQAPFRTRVSTRGENGGGSLLSFRMFVLLGVLLYILYVLFW